MFVSCMNQTYDFTGLVGAGKECLLFIPYKDKNKDFITQYPKLNFLVYCRTSFSMISFERIWMNGLFDSLDWI